MNDRARLLLHQTHAFFCLQGIPSLSSIYEEFTQKGDNSNILEIRKEGGGVLNDHDVTVVQYYIIGLHP